jgi:hypothetical protein
LPDTSLASSERSDYRSSYADRIRGAIFPSTSRFHHVHDPAQNSPIVFALWTGLVCRQMRLNFRPLLIAEPEQAAARLGLRFG